MLTENLTINEYRTLAAQLEGLFEGEPDLVANLANASAILNDALTDINWVGFYLLKAKQNLKEKRDLELVLGPFQGHPACIRIPVGRGVCGTAVEKDEVQLVPDVHAFPGHIACDGASRSEIVIPLHENGMVVGVLDIDSPTTGRFTEGDREGLLLCAGVIEQMLSENLLLSH